MWLEGRSAPLTADAVVLTDAEIRDTATGRFIDRDKLHYVHFEGAHFRVRGPAIVPRPPQGHPVVAIDATDPVTWQTAARHADVALVRATGPDAAGRIGMSCGTGRWRTAGTPTRSPCSPPSPWLWATASAPPNSARSRAR